MIDKINRHLEGGPPESERAGSASYRRLFGKFVFYTVICSVIPLLIVGWGLYWNYTRISNRKMVESFKAQIENHQKTIQLFLDERKSELQLISGAHTLDELTAGGKLQQIFDLINKDYWSFTDLGVIDEKGNHLSYIGPYDLLEKNYAETFWFKEVLEKGLYISDMFMGFREEPHFIIALARREKGRNWILRATINTEYFRSLVENVCIGKTGEACLVNRAGIYQTTPRFHGRIMDKAPFPITEPQKEISVRISDSRTNPNGLKTPRKIESMAWLKEPPWILMVQQDYSEAFADVNHANMATLLFLHIAAATILVAATLITRHMIRLVKKRDIETDNLNDQLLQTGKMAAIGELSAGVAHEINNPLAIILTEKQLLLDALKHTKPSGEEFEAQLMDSISQIDTQVQRCKRITHNLLRFARRTESVIEAMNINDFLRELIELTEREAKTSGIKIRSHFDPDLPTVFSDPSQLQQVFLNLLTNAVDAHESKPYGTITITTVSGRDNQLFIVFEDTGIGISNSDAARIFDPFFTTKSVGKGTGLGLSICFSIMKRLGGSIRVESEVGKGSKFTLTLPINPPGELMEQMRLQNEALIQLGPRPGQNPDRPGSDRGSDRGKALNNSKAAALSPVGSPK